MKTAIAGIDFSGGADAGKRIWIAHGRPAGDGLTIEACYPASELPDSGTHRSQAIRALVAWIGRQPNAVIGLDTALGMPQNLMGGQSWQEYLRALPARFPDAESFRAYNFRLAHGKELRRWTDTDARTPFSPYNLRMYRQTYYGLRDVVRPLVVLRKAVVAPMQVARPGKAVLIEVCPASTLKRMSLYLPYKGGHRDYRVIRTRILAMLNDEDALAFADTTLEARVVEDNRGDALDAVLAAIAAGRAQRRGSLAPPRQVTRCKVEGYVYT